MKEDLQNNTKAIIQDKSAYNKKIKAEPKPEQNIGVDTNKSIIQNIIGEGEVSQIDFSAINNFTQVSRSRDQLYAALDTMASDSIVAALLEIYAEDATEANEEGKIVWAESDDPNILKFINFLIDTMCIDKNIYKWVYSFCTYGDLYVRLYRQSETDIDDIFKPKENLNEDINVKTYSKNDNYSHYIEMVSNPAEMFELTRFGKTMGFIKTNITPVAANKDASGVLSGLYTYKYNKQDIDIYDPTNFVHASLDDISDRTSEEVQIFLNNSTDKEKNITYKVKRGQSLLYSEFKAWRELSLLENSVLLNRITKSSIVRLIQVEVGDMAKESIGPHLLRIKQMMEQKAAIDDNNYLSEYTNPGPIENNVYVPTNNGKGAISTAQVGGDVNVGDLVDLDYFQNKFFGGMRVPKQFVGQTDDNAGFSGGQSLAIISSRYAKAIKRIQKAMTQMITDCINLMLIDKGLKGYINKFKIKMQPPTTQEEIDKRENLSAKVGIVRDTMDLLGDVQDPVIKLKMLKSLLPNIVGNDEVIALLEEQIEQLETENEYQPTQPEEKEESDFSSSDLDKELDLERPSSDTESPINNSEEESLPTPEELGIGDLTNNLGEQE